MELSPVKCAPILPERDSAKIPIQVRRKIPQKKGQKPNNNKNYNEKSPSRNCIKYFCFEASASTGSSIHTYTHTTC